MLSKPSPDYNVAWRLGQYLSFESLMNTSLPGDMVPLFFLHFLASIFNVFLRWLHP